MAAAMVINTSSTYYLASRFCIAHFMQRIINFILSLFTYFNCVLKDKMMTLLATFNYLAILDHLKYPYSVYSVSGAFFISSHS